MEQLELRCLQVQVSYRTENTIRARRFLGFPEKFFLQGEKSLSPCEIPHSNVTNGRCKFDNNNHPAERKHRKALGITDTMKWTPTKYGAKRG